MLKKLRKKFKRGPAVGRWLKRFRLKRTWMDIKDETFVIYNPDGSFSLDAYAGMSREQLKEHCGGLCVALSEWQFIAMALFDGGKENLPERWQKKVGQLIEAYRDDKD